MVRGLPECVPVEHSSDRHVWVAYVDADFMCSKHRGELGAGGDGVTILHCGDLDGLVDPNNLVLCPDEVLPPRSTYGWIGGLSHEVGHAFGLLHPPGCDENLSHCDADALMWTGYFYDYLETYLTEEDSATLE